MYKPTSQVACKGVITESLKSTSISSGAKYQGHTRKIQGSASFLLQGAYKSVNGNFDDCTKDVLAEIQAEESSKSEGRVLL